MLYPERGRGHRLTTPETRSARTTRPEEKTPQFKKSKSEADPKSTLSLSDLLRLCLILSIGRLRERKRDIYIALDGAKMEVFVLFASAVEMGGCVLF